MLVVNSWENEFRALYGGSWPSSYCCLDVESSGLNMSLDVVLEFGHCIVRDREISERYSLVLDWTNHPVVADQWLRRRLKELASHYRGKGLDYELTYDKLRKEGIKPEEAFDFYRHFFDLVFQEQLPLITFNGMGFDYPMIEANFRGFTETDFSVENERVIDLGAVFKATEAGPADSFLPKPGEELYAYFRRICRRPVKIGWSLEKAIERYGISKELENERMHRAGTDSFALYLLMEKMRNEVRELTPVTEKPVQASPRRKSKKRRRRQRLY